MIKLVVHPVYGIPKLKGYKNKYPESHNIKKKEGSFRQILLQEIIKNRGRQTS